MCSIGAIPLRPARMPAQLEATSSPSGVSMPRPVTTTRLRNMAQPSSFSKNQQKLVKKNRTTNAWMCGFQLYRTAATLLRVRVNVVDGFLYSGDLLGFFVRNFSLEFFFQSHDQLNGVQRVGTQIFDERSTVGNFFQFDTQLFGYNFLNALFNSAHCFFAPEGSTRQPKHRLPFKQSGALYA